MAHARAEPAAHRAKLPRSRRRVVARALSSDVILLLHGICQLYDSRRMSCRGSSFSFLTAFERFSFLLLEGILQHGWIYITIAIENLQGQFPERLKSLQEFQSPHELQSQR